MHEIGYCAGVLEAVERRAAGRPVARIGVLVGALHRISPAAFEQSFQLVADGGIAAGAGTEVLIAPVRASCTACRAAFDSTEAAPTCPQCHSTEVATEGGDELVLQWVEYAQPQQHDGAGAREHAGLVSGAAREHADAIPAAVREQVGLASEAAREHADPVPAAVREHAGPVAVAVREDH